MTRILLWIIGILILIGVVWMVWSLVTRGESSTTATSTPSGSVFPNSGTNASGSTTGGSSSQGTQSNETMSVTGLDGSAVAVNNFIDNGVTIPDTENAGNYELAGSLGYCLPNMKCVATPTTDYNIGYDSSSDIFTIALLKEPLGQSRNEAAQFLESTLGISANQLCNLKYFVSTTYFVNELYDNKNLGFAGCPGATVLPN